MRFYTAMVIAPGRKRSDNDKRPVQRAANFWKARSPITSGVQAPNLSAQHGSPLQREKLLASWLDPRTLSYADQLDVRHHIEDIPLHHIAQFLGRRYSKKRSRKKRTNSLKFGFCKSKSKLDGVRRQHKFVSTFYKVLREILRPLLQRSHTSSDNSIVWQGCSAKFNQSCGLDILPQCTVCKSNEELVQIWCRIAYLHKGPTPTAANEIVTWKIDSTNKIATLSVVLSKPWATLLKITLETMFHCETIASLAEHNSFLSATLCAARNTVVCGLRFCKVVDLARCDYAQRVQMLTDLKTVLQTLEVQVCNPSI